MLKVAIVVGTFFVLKGLTHNKSVISQHQIRGKSRGRSRWYWIAGSGRVVLRVSVIAGSGCVVRQVPVIAGSGGVVL